MKKIIIYIICFLITGINVSYAANGFTNPPKLINATSDSLTITWDKIDNASGYYVYYGDKSGDNQKSFGDIFTTEKTTITGLESSKTYYIYITYLDKNTNEESIFSPEGVFNTKIGNEEKFALTDIKVINAKNLELTFNYGLDKTESSVREFKITKNNKEINTNKNITINEFDDKIINIELENPLEIGEYKLVVIYLTDSKGRNIEEGINGELKFTVTENNLSVEINEDNTIVNQELIDENIELDAGTPEETGEYYGLAGKAMTGVLSNGEVVAQDSKKLPKTGPESMIIIFLSMILGVIFIKSKKTI